MPRLAALFGIFLISFSAVWVRLASVSPSTAAFYRCVYALPFLALLWWIGRRRDKRPARARWMAIGAGLIFGLNITSWHHAIEYIGIGLATVLGNTQIVFVGLLAWALHGERPPGRAFALIPVIFSGVVLVSGLGGEDAYGANPFLGVVFGLMTGLAYSLFLLALRHSSRSLSSAVGPLLDASLGGAITSMLLGFADGSLIFAPHWPAHGWLLALALVSQTVGWPMITVALPRLPALETSVLLVLQPVLTVLWGYLIFREVLSGTQWGGVALVLGGVAALSILGALAAKSSRSARMTERG